jgi:hypothetical protein
MKYLIFELFSGVGFCNQLFSLESAIYLSNITDRKLILLIKNSLCHCGRNDWKYGKIMEMFTDDYLKYLPNGIEIYYKSIPSNIIKLTQTAFHFTNKTFSNTIFIDKELNTPENKDDIQNFSNDREKIEINYDELKNHEYLYIPNDISNASRCFYNYYTNKKNIVLMNKICSSLTNYNAQIKSKLALIKDTLINNTLVNNTSININFQYNAVHFRFGDYYVNGQEITKHNDKILQKFDELFTTIGTSIGTTIGTNTMPIFIMCDRKDNKILEILKEKYTIIFTDEYIGSIPDCKFPDERSVENYLLEKYICENAITFIGTSGSTVSNYIQYNRYLNNKQANINFQKTIINSSINKYSWNDNNVSSHPISWSLFFNDNIIKCNMSSYLQIVKSFNINPNKDKKVISFSIYGIGQTRDNDRGFYKGIFVNYELAKIIYPGWIVRIYLPYNEPAEFIKNLIKMKDIEIILVDTNMCLRAIRFLPKDDPLVDVWISRDLDSIVTYREKAAVDDWLTNFSDKELHIMTDNSQHYWTIAGGMFGVKNINNINNNLTDFMLEFSENKSVNDYAVDCTIAEGFFYKKDNYIQHYGSGKKLENSKPFPPHDQKNCSFVGDIVNINKYYIELDIKNKYFNNSSLLKNNDIFSYPPWNTNCVLNWYNETDFTLTPIKTNTSTCGDNSCLKTENGDGIKLMTIGTHVNVLWDGYLHKEVYLEDENTIIVIHDNSKYKFTYVFK